MQANSGGGQLLGFLRPRINATQSQRISAQCVSSFLRHELLLVTKTAFKHVQLYCLSDAVQLHYAQF